MFFAVPFERATWAEFFPNAWADLNRPQRLTVFGKNKGLAAILALILSGGYHNGPLYQNVIVLSF